MPTKSDDDLAENDLAIPLEDSATWQVLKEMVLIQIAALSEGSEKNWLQQFVTKHWPGHAPRSREISQLTTKITLLKREKQRLLSIPTK